MLLPSSKRDGFGQSIGLGIGIIFELATHWSLDSKSLLIASLAWELELEYTVIS